MAPQQSFCFTRKHLTRKRLGKDKHSSLFRFYIYDKNVVLLYWQEGPYLENFISFLNYKNGHSKLECCITQG